MALNDFNVKAQLTRLFKEYFHSPFASLKETLIGATTEEYVHEQIRQELDKIKKSDIEESIRLLRDKAYEQQIKDDKQEEIRDQQQNENDDRKAAQLRTTQSSEISLKTIVQFELSALRTRRDLVIVSAMNNHPHPGNTHHHSEQQHQHQHADQSLYNAEILTLEQRIVTLSASIASIDGQLNALKHQKEERRIRKNNRYNRLQNRVSYLSEIASVYETLSLTNSRNLESSILATQTSLENKCTSLIEQARHQNYAVFLEQLELFLQSHPKYLKEEEITALLRIVGLMKEHQEYQRNISEQNKKLDAATKQLDDCVSELARQNNRLTQLQSEIPRLEEENNTLKESNVTLNTSMQRYKELRRKNTIGAMVSLGVLLLGSIPLALGLAGIISMTTPIVLISLIAPPAILIIPALVLVVFALIYAYRYATDKSTIETNERTIENNKGTIGDKEQGINQIQLTLIPGLERTIEHKTNEKEVCARTLADLKQYVADLIKLARETKPEPMVILERPLQRFYSIASGSRNSPVFFENDNSVPLVTAYPINRESVNEENVIPTAPNFPKIC